jgi:hypothetical protein
MHCGCGIINFLLILLYFRLHNKVKLMALIRKEKKLSSLLAFVFLCIRSHLEIYVDKNYLNTRQGFVYMYFYE